MAVRDRLRRRFNVEGEAKGPNAPRDSDEDILNVLRRELQDPDGDDELTTSDVADQLSIKTDQTSNRLSELKDENRVEKRRAGRADMWSLAEGEPETVVDPELGDIIAVSADARRRGEQAKSNGVKICGLGFVLLLVGMTALLPATASISFIAPYFLAFGYSCGLVGAFISMSGVVLGFAADITPRLAKRHLVE